MNLLTVKPLNKLKIRIFALVAVSLIAFPLFAISSHSGDLYVNKNASGKQDGSKSHPYRTIGQALDKADSGDEIHVAKGEYEENITLKKNIKLYGADKNDTIIRADKDKWSVVYMEDDSKIDGFTIKGGEKGIRVDKKAEAYISNCIVRKNDDDGISIEGDKKAKKSRKVSISKSEIRDNGRAGIYSQGPRRIVITNSEISDNKTDGIDLARGTSAWLEKNSIKDNGGSGLKLDIGGSDVWTKRNSIRRNDHQGIEVNYFGSEGNLHISHATFEANKLYAIARVQRNIPSLRSAVWNRDLILENNNNFWSPRLGNVSGILNFN